MATTLQMKTGRGADTHATPTTRADDTSPVHVRAGNLSLVGGAR